MPSSIYAGEKTVHPFDHIFVLMLENATRGDVLDNAYMRQLCNKGVFLKNSFGVTHSSQPNYIVSIGGDNLGITDDSPNYVQWVYDPQPYYPAVPVSSLVDLLEEKGFTWKAYAENLPEGYLQAAAAAFQVPPPPSAPVPPAGQAPMPTIPADNMNGDTPHFARKHVPFLSFPNIITNSLRAANIVDATQLNVDLAAGQLPNFSWYTPNLINDGHDLKAGQSPQQDGDDRKLRMQNIAAFLEGLWGHDPLSKFPPKTLIILTFDEAYPYSDPYEIYTLLIGDALYAPGTRSEPYNHYSMLRSVEMNFGLNSLQRNDAVANPYWFLR